MKKLSIFALMALAMVTSTLPVYGLFRKTSRLFTSRFAQSFGRLFNKQSNKIDRASDPKASLYDSEDWNWHVENWLDKSYIPYTQYANRPMTHYAPNGYYTYKGNPFQRATHWLKLLYAGRHHDFRRWEYDKTKHLRFAAQTCDKQGLQWYLKNGHVNARDIELAMNSAHPDDSKDCNWIRRQDIRNELTRELAKRNGR